MGKPKSQGIKSDRVKQSTIKYKKRRGFGGSKTGIVNNVNNDAAGSSTTTSTELVNIVNNASTPSAVNTSTESKRLPVLDKIQTIISETPKQHHKISGYRIMDMELLSTVFSIILCPECEHSSLTLIDRVSHKKGMASLLLLQCSRLNCDFKKEFYTSNFCNENKSFDVNKRMVYTMRTLGNGHAGIEKFTHLMNMPKPMAKTSYEKISDKIGDVAKEVAEQSMKDAADELREGKRSEEVVDIGVSCVSSP